MGAQIRDRIPWGIRMETRGEFQMCGRTRPGTSPSGRAPRAKAVTGLWAQAQTHNPRPRPDWNSSSGTAGPRASVQSTNSFALRGWSDRLAPPGLASHLGRRALLSWLALAAISSTELNRRVVLPSRMDGFRLAYRCFSAFLYDVLLPVLRDGNRAGSGHIFADFGSNGFGFGVSKFIGFEFGFSFHPYIPNG